MLAALALAVALGSTAPEDVGVVFLKAAGGSGLAAACPRIAVAEDAGAIPLLSTFFEACPGGEAALQLPPATFTPTVPPTLVGAADARLDADRYWSTASMVLPPGLAPASRAATWLAGPALDTFPSWRNDPACDAGAAFCAADYMGVFWDELDRLARAEGFRGLVLPPFAPQPGDRPDALCRVLAVVDAFGSDVAWTWDAVSPAMATSEVAERDTTFGYRGLRDRCAPAAAHPLLVRVSVAGGWQGRTDVSGFMSWVRWLDGAVDADPDPFLGLAMFGFGSGDGNDLEPAAAELAAYLVDPGAVPGGGGSHGGVGPPTPPPTQPGSNLEPDGGPHGGCSTGGYGGGWALILAAAVAARGARLRA